MGRPKGSKNKPKVVIDNSPEANAVAEQDAVTEEVKL